MPRPNTDGCTEWSCMYHGGDNRFKAAHFEGCALRASSRPVFAIAEDPQGEACTCWPRDEAEGLAVERFLEDSTGLDEPPGFDMQYDAWDEPRDVREGWER